MTDDAHIVDVRFVRQRDSTWCAYVEGERVPLDGEVVLSIAMLRLALSRLDLRDYAEVAHVLNERSRQRSLGHTDDVDYPDGTGSEAHVRALDRVRHDVQFAEQTDSLTWAHVLREEVAEVLAEREDLGRLRAELHQVAAVAVRWAGALRRRMGK